ncbi:MAG: PspC domain-containing protein, partial [Nocardioides sp.]
MTDDTTQGPPEPDSPPAAGGDTTTATAPPPADEPGPTRPVFRRSTTDKVVAGVSGGLARTFDIDPV